MTIEQAKDQVAQKYGWGLWINIRMNGNFHTSPDIDKMVTEAAELYCQSQKAQAWDEGFESATENYVIGFNSVEANIDFYKPINPYLTETKKD